MTARRFSPALLVIFALIALPWTATAQQTSINWMSLEEAVAAQQDEPRKIMMDVYTQWCGPCKMIGPALEEIADNLSDQLTVAKINIDDNPATPAKFGVRGIPTLMLFKDGDVAATKVGALPKSQLEDWVKSNI